SVTSFAPPFLARAAPRHGGPLPDDAVCARHTESTVFAAIRADILVRSRLLMTSQLRSTATAAGTLDSRPSAPAERRLRVLLLEDDAADAELEVRALTAGGVEFTWERVDTEPAFIASLESGAYDVVLSDYNLPAFNGLRALHILRARGYDVPFILV